MISLEKTRPRYTSTGKHSGFETTIYHSGLDEYRHVSAKETDILEDKVHNVTRILSEKWERELAKRAREQDRLEKLGKKEIAVELTKQASDDLAELDQILAATLSIDDTIDLDALKSNKPFKTDKFAGNPHYNVIKGGRPNKIKVVSKPLTPSKEAPPIREDKPIKFLDKLFGRSEKISSENEANWEKQLADYKSVLQKQQKDYEQKIALYEAELDSRETSLVRDQIQWDELQAKFLADQSQGNNLLGELKAGLFRHEIEAVEEYNSMVLGNSDYPEFFTVNYEVEYNRESKVLIIEYQLPEPNDIPTLKSVGYVASRDEFTEKHISDAQKKRLFNSVIYQIALRSIHEVLEADQADALDMVTFNGVVTAINNATGKPETNCIITLQVTADELNEINLAAVDPKACFKALKGVAASNLISITPVRPLMKMNRHDARFTEHYDVADALDGSTNLAAMNWEDFEHLIRELFSKEFSGDGSEVRVTKASRDGGVDAVAFDPDPIRGGKIVIQAKRYTNTVGVSAVRDLYGTVTSEGAIKGILVTTADYGPDAYKFAANKPLTLLNGANLLHMLREHGHKAYIDTKEAKLLLSETP